MPHEAKLTGYQAHTRSVAAAAAAKNYTRQRHQRLVGHINERNAHSSLCRGGVERAGDLGLETGKL